MQLKAVIFDLGNTLIRQQVDTEVPLDRMTLDLVPHVREVLPILSSAYRLGIVSNTTQSTGRHVRRALDYLGIGEYFTIIITSIDCRVEKPDRRLFQVALGHLQATPLEAVMIGNDPVQDIAGAHAAGLWTGLFDSGDSGVMTKADFVFADFRALPQKLAQLESM